MLHPKVVHFEAWKVIIRWCTLGDRRHDGDIDHDHFMDLSHVVDRSLLSDLKAIGVPDNSRITFRDRGIAASSGILEYGLTESRSEDQKPELATRLSKYGTDLRNILLGRFKERIEVQREQRSRLEEIMG